MLPPALEALVRDVVPWLRRPELQTAITLAVLGVARLVAEWRIRRMAFPSVEERRRWLVSSRNLLFLVLTLALVVIWNDQIQTLVLSVVAIAAAVVLATKEIILCASGALWRTATRAFDIGDRIEVNGFRGDVIDHGLLGTTLLEVGPGHASNQASGRAIVLPNSLFLTYALVNETFTDAYVLHPFALQIGRKDDWRTAERVLLDAANAECAPFLDDAKASIGRQVAKYALPNLGLDPRVSIGLQDSAHIELLVRVPVPVRQKSKIEQAILRRFLAGMEAPPAPTPVPAAAAAPGP